MARVKRYVVDDATRDTLSSMVVGHEYSGRDLHTAIIRNLRYHGNESQPYDSTTLRSVRRYASLYGVKCHQAGTKSKYIKGEPSEAKNTPAPC